ncbi:MAG: phosphoenolpyruvate--protein phosphotransferase [Acidimicrobiales bacterium]
MTTIRGVGASSGAAVGPAWVHRVAVPTVPSGLVDDPDAEAQRLAAALEAVSTELGARAAEVGGELGEILDAQAAMAADPELAELAGRAVRDDLVTAARAVIDACEAYATMLADSDNEYLAARAQDVRDVGSRVARRLLGLADPDLASLAHPVIVVADDLAPADLAAARTDRLLALATEQGSRTSHTAIVARALGIPAVVGAAGLLAVVADTATVAVDGDAGEVHVVPDADTVAAIKARAATAQQGRRRLAEVAGTEPAATADGVRIELAANVATLAETEAAVANGAEGVGLLRTELLYVNAAKAPSVEQQAETFAAIADALNGRRLVIRTFDFGADKPVPFLPTSAEPNPALGVRGLRLAREHPELLVDQLQAIAQAARSRPERLLAVMAPMVATTEEAEWFRTQVDAVDIAGVEVGIMVEVPSAVFLARELAYRLDFLSIGTNDLTQYLHAADRQAGRLAELQDPFAPAVLRAVGQVCRAADGKAWVGVCGEAGGDPAWALVAVGLGVRELSMGPDALLRVKAALRRCPFSTCQHAARQAIGAVDAKSARAAAEAALGEALSL